MKINDLNKTYRSTKPVMVTNDPMRKMYNLKILKKDNDKLDRGQELAQNSNTKEKGNKISTFSKVD